MSTYCDQFEIACATYDCKKLGGCQNLIRQKGPSNLHHTHNTDYEVSLCGINIPVIKTNRIFNATYYSRYSLPLDFTAIVTDFINITNCGEYDTEYKESLVVSEDCSIISSTLHYVDHRYKMVLYKKTTDTIKMFVSSELTAGFKESSGTGVYHMALITEENYGERTERREEWVLSLGGVESVVATYTQKLHPFGPKNDGRSLIEIDPEYKGLYPDFRPDPEVRKILILDQPPSQAIPYTDYVVRLGFYDYGNLPGGESELNKLDGGGKDMFYPEWCRNLQSDPVWRAVADRRYAVTWFHDDLIEDHSYKPPPITVDPIPRGTFVRHPEVGNVYQFLLELSSGSTHLETSPNLDSIIQASLPEELRSTGTTLYYPIGVL